MTWEVWASVRLAGGMGTDLGLEVYRRTLYQPYSVHVAQNSSDLISSLIGKITLTILSLSACLTLLTSLVMVLFISAALLVACPQITLMVGAVFVVFYGSMALLSQKKLMAYSQVISSEQNYLAKLS